MRYMSLCRAMELALVVIVLGAGTSRAVADPPAICSLGTFGGSYSRGYGINASGQVTGSSSTTDGVMHAFLYTGTPGNGGAMADLGVGGPGVAINAQGQVALYSGTVALAFLYTGTPGSGGARADLGTLDGDYSAGLAINASGQVVARKRGH